LQNGKKVEKKFGGGGCGREMLWVEIEMKNGMVELKIEIVMVEIEASGDCCGCLNRRIFELSVLE
jgi:hypothetical protein